MDDWLDNWYDVEELDWDEEWERGNMLWHEDMPVHITRLFSLDDLTRKAA